MFLSGLSFWRHPFTADDPLVTKWCNAKFLQICSDKSNDLGWPKDEYIFRKFSFLDHRGHRDHWLTMLLGIAAQLMSVIFLFLPHPLCLSSSCFVLTGMNTHMFSLSAAVPCRGAESWPALFNVICCLSLSWPSYITEELVLSNMKSCVPCEAEMCLPLTNKQSISS